MLENVCMNKPKHPYNYESAGKLTQKERIAYILKNSVSLIKDGRDGSLLLWVDYSGAPALKKLDDLTEDEAVSLVVWTVDVDAPRDVIKKTAPRARLYPSKKARVHCK